MVSYQAVPGCNQNFTRASQLPMAYEFSSLKWGKLGEILIAFFRLLDSSVDFQDFEKIIDMTFVYVLGGP